MVGLLSTHHARLHTKFRIVSQCINNGPGFRTDHSVHRKAEALLELPDRCFGLRAEAPVDPARVKTNRTHPALKAAHRQTGRAKPQNGLALVRFVDIDPRHPADNPVHRDATHLLKRLYRALGLRSKGAIDRSRIVSQYLESVLQIPNSRVG